MVDVRSDRSYRFAAPPQRLWEAMTDIGGYRGWWPWLRQFDATAFEADAEWSCVVQPPMPYAVRFTVALDEVDEPTRVRASVRGDIVGSAELTVRPAGDGSEARLVSQLAPSNGVLRAVARVARPLVRFGHDWVLDTGARQFRARALP